jgi:ribosome biogenesis GTPase
MDPVAIGDEVTFVPGDANQGMILEIHPRRNYLARASAKPMPSAHCFEQVIAANVDQVIPVFATAEPTPSWHLLDRYLVTAESYGIPAVIIITKMDLNTDQAAEKDLFDAVKSYQRIGYPVILTSAKERLGLGQLTESLHDKVSVLLGKSGVGKTSLLNMIEPDLGLRVKSVNTATGKGRHTTTHLELFPLGMGGGLIDTPGVREFGLWIQNEDNLDYFFPEMRSLIGGCKFGLNCEHDEEPGCVIRQAVMEGKISPLRYQSYLHLKSGL